MTDGDSLFAAILAHPDEDTPRLAYADWLDEQGGRQNEDRAEFIRLQIELHDADGPDTPARAKKERRVHALQRRYDKRWERPLIGKGGPLFGEHTFTNYNRGFISRVGGHAENWVANGDEVFRLAPITNANVEVLTDAAFKKMLKCRWVTRLHTMELSSPFEDGETDEPGRPPDFAAFAGVRLPRLKFLWFSAGVLTASGAARVAAADPMPNVETLQLHQTPLTPQTITKLFGKKAFASVRELYLGDCDVGAAELTALARCKALAGVKKLALAYHELNDDGLAALTTAAFWPTIRRLEIDRGEIGVAGMRALAENPGGLEELQLEDCQIRTAGVQLLAEGNALRRLKDLDLSGNMIADAGVIALTRSPHVAGLTDLDLAQNGLSSAAAKALAECPGVAGLERLTLYGNPIGADGFKALAKSPYLGNLRWLHVGDIKGKTRKLLAERFGDRVCF